MLSSGQIANESTSRSGIVSEHERVSSHSHSNNNFWGFVIDSVNMTISLPEEKQLAKVQKANSLLGQNLISNGNLCQFMDMCSATRPALRQAPLFYRKIQLSINTVLGKTGPNKKLCSNKKIPPDFRIVRTKNGGQWRCHTIAQLH